MKNKKSVLDIIKKILNIICVVVAVVFILVVCLQRFSGNKLSFFNYRMFTVVSGSMEPKYKIGDVLISKNVEASKIKVGDTISYLGEKGDFRDKVITHAVIDIDQDKEGNYIFHTQGLSNLVEDPIVYERQLYGVVTHRAVILSFIYKIVGSKYGLFVFVILPLLYIIGSEVISAMLESEEKRRENLK